MADPLSITASLLAIVTAAVQSSSSLHETVKRYKERNNTLRRLQNELEDLVKILSSLALVIDTEVSMLELLQGPVDRCSQVCHDFEQAMKQFSGKSTPGLRDWAKMEFRKGDINQFIDTITSYKSTISIGLGTITMHNSKVSQKVLQEYNEMVKDTAYNLEVHLQQIDEKLARFTTENTHTSPINIDLNNERAVTEQCLRICEDARSYIDSLSHRESNILPNLTQTTAENNAQDQFEAQLLTRHALDENRDHFVGIIGRLAERLDSLIKNGNSGNDDERLRLQEDISISKQCLEVCKVANAASSQKIYRVGEAIAGDDSDQVVVNTLADLFDVKKVQSSGQAAQLIGSMTPEALRHLAHDRYNSSRFRAFVGSSDPAGRYTTSSHSVGENQTGDEEPPRPKTTLPSPSPNEVRKRMANSITHQGFY